MRKTIPSFILFFCFLVAGVNAVAAKPVMLTSPDGNIVFTFTLNNHQPAYSIVYKKNPLINNSPLVLLFDDGNAFASSVISNKPVSHKETNDYKLIIGKTTAVHDVCNNTIISLTGNYKVNIEVKVFNDGVAFRYTFPPQQKKQFLLKEERTAFSLNGDPIVKALLLPNYITSHEGLYRTAALSEMPSDSLMDMPALFQAGKTFIAITEASLLDYAGMYLIKHGGNMEGILSPLPGTNGVKVKGSFPHQSPWRVMMISDRMGALLESNILTTLCEPTKFTETSWIKPGLTTFPWWNGTVIPDTSFAPGNNFQTNQYYIDFCAANDVRYHTIVEAGGHEWYTNDGTGYQPGKNADVTKPVDGLDMKAICDYAHAKNVGVRVWVHWKALYPQLDSAFAIFEKWGLSGMMVDFMDRDDQEMVNIQKEILEKAARHHLHIQFHGAYKPTGLHRTYPNEFTREGTLNYENDKWNNLVTPDADLDIAVTRLLAGSTDYHLGGFRASSFETLKFVIHGHWSLEPVAICWRCM
ncbi:MAG: glycoside hydrolase family 97 protein [Pedobacter sp.]|nr:MAG: glycoside hydrolase family 97 protein [Pedobacter sp.]